MAESTKPTLKAIILDFSSVNNVDITSVQHLIDIRNQLDRYTAPKKVDWHMACINNRWTKRALASAGFGYLAPEDGYEGFQRWKPIFSVAEIGGQDSAATAAEMAENEQHLRQLRSLDVEKPAGYKDAIEQHDKAISENNSGSDLDRSLSASKAYGKDAVNVKVAVVHGLNRPLFHIDLTSALQSAIANAERKGEDDVRSGVGTKTV